jgi:hypothetical protein
MRRGTEARWPGAGAPAATVAALLLSLVLSAPASAATVDAGSLRAERDGTDLTLTQPGSPGSTLRLAGTQPSGLVPTVKRVGEGLIRVRFDAPPTTLKVRASFARPEGERFLGFGERSDAVARTSGTVTHRVTEGPFQPVERPFIAAFVPLPGYDTRDDMTYYPLPWLLSTRGYGVLIENDHQSRNILGSPWSAEADARHLSLLIVAGPTPREVLERFSATSAASRR